MRADRPFPRRRFSSQTFPLSGKIGKRDKLFGEYPFCKDMPYCVSITKTSYGHAFFEDADGVRGRSGAAPVGSCCDKGQAGIPGDSARAMVVGVRHASRSPGCGGSGTVRHNTIAFRQTVPDCATSCFAALPAPVAAISFPAPPWRAGGMRRFRGRKRNPAFALIRAQSRPAAPPAPVAAADFPAPPWRAGGMRGGVCRLTRAPAARCLCCPVGQGVPVMQGDVAAPKTAGTVEPRAGPMYNNIRDLHVKQDVMGGGAVKKAFWVLWIGAIAVFFLDWAFMGISLLNGDYEIRTAVYLAAACFVVILAGSVYRLWSSRCPYCGKALPLRGKYCPHCGKEVGA